MTLNCCKVEFSRNFACLGGYNMEYCRSPDGITSVSVRPYLHYGTQCCRAFTLALARLSC